MEILTILAIGTLNVVCFFVGAKIGQKVAKGETIETPNLNPVDVWHEHKEKVEAFKEHEKYKAILDNVERYNGSAYGQKDVPR